LSFFKDASGMLGGHIDERALRLRSIRPIISRGRRVTPAITPTRSPGMIS
jgi:hypothetical protein